MRQIVLDTETTGLEPKQGHRIIEIGCVEIQNRRTTGNDYHVYLNPDREIEDGAFEVHGISTEFLQDKPRFKDIAQEFVNYLRDAELIIHNAPFDVGFIDAELRRIGKKWGKTEDYCTVTDSLMLARQMHPGQKNSLDALCKRYEVDNSHRDLHGALLDAQILVDVYLAMTGGQTDLSLQHEIRSEDGAVTDQWKVSSKRGKIPVLQPTEEELSTHHQRMQQIAEKSGGNTIWDAMMEQE